MPMKTWVSAVVALGMLSGCIQQGVPHRDDLPGAECRLVTHRLVMPQMSSTEQDPETLGKKVALRESEEAQLRDYLVRFTEQAPRSIVTYAPRTVLYGETFALNFHSDKVILNIGYGTRQQFERARTREDDNMLKLLKKRSNSRTLSL